MTDQALLSELQFALLEPPDGGASWPSEAWSRDEVLDGLNAGIRDLLRSTHLVVTRAEQAVLAGATSVALPTDHLATVHLVWRTVANLRTPLGPVDSFEADLALPSWETSAASPLAYADLDGATLTLKLVPTPLAAGTLELLYIARPADVTGRGGTLPLPDEFLSGVKYATLGWLLTKVGRLMDPERAAYCQQRAELTEMAAELIISGWS